MKSATDPRHQERRKLVKELFASTFATQEVSPQAQKIISSQKKLDQEIAKAAPAWSIEKVNKIDLTILRLAIYELEKTDAPPKVIIDEAVELAKEFGGETSPGFVNGVLGTVLKTKSKTGKSKK
jgi:N utilization substance protein B